MGETPPATGCYLDLEPLNCETGSGAENSNAGDSGRIIVGRMIEGIG